MRSAVITREYFPHIRVSILLGEVGTVHPGRVTAALRVHEKFRVWNVPLYGAQRFRYEFLERQPRVVHPDLMATKRGARATCNYYKTISSRSSRFKPRVHGLTSTFSAACPGAILQSLGVNVVGDDAGNSVWRKVGQDRGHCRFHDERDQKKEGEDGEYGRGTQAEGGVEFSFLHQSHHLHHRQHPAYGAWLGVLFLGAHDHRRLVGINDCYLLCGAAWTPFPSNLWKLSPPFASGDDDYYGSLIDRCFRGNFIFSTNRFSLFFLFGSLEFEFNESSGSFFFLSFFFPPL